MNSMSPQTSSLLRISLLSVAMMAALAWLPRAAAPRACPGQSPALLSRAPTLLPGLLALRGGQVDAARHCPADERGGQR